MSAAGFYWCLKCHRPTELLDSDQGLAGRRCAVCHSTKIEWRNQPTPAPAADWALDPPERPAQKRHRLPQDKRNLRTLADQGYYFCDGCQNVTEIDNEHLCVLCHSHLVEWHDPVFNKEEES